MKTETMEEQIEFEGTKVEQGERSMSGVNARSYLIDR